MTVMDVLKWLLWIFWSDCYGCFEMIVMDVFKWLLWMFLNDCCGCFEMTVMDVLQWLLWMFWSDCFGCFEVTVMDVSKWLVWMLHLRDWTPCGGVEEDITMDRHTTTPPTNNGRLLLRVTVGRLRLHLLLCSSALWFFLCPTPECSWAWPQRPNLLHYHQTKW